MIELFLFILCMFGAMLCLIGACYIAVIIALCKFICPKIKAKKKAAKSENVKPNMQQDDENECCACVCAWINGRKE